MVYKLGGEAMEKDFEVEVLNRLTKIETKLDDYIEKRITDIEDKLKWISRTTIGAIITGAIAIIFLLVQYSIGLK